ncbi:ShlB/FhaC/HecB family hemolysin secretion/activation protein [Polaribacter ponticola]|uniref:ShlB/FhaC/HecB family hemolysin secretion/activation protein n=1 Tax=Polaribacter ponticola TaxID=2978475 RepID=UPI003B67A28B
MNKRNNLFLKNNTGYLNSDDFLNNELFRIGGNNTIRGFNERSIFTNNYTYFNIEYRYLTSKESYLYSITDVAKIKNRSKNNLLIGLGLGYLFKIKESLINIGYVLGKEKNNKFNYNDSKLIITWKSFF